jgi:hypothetical protein
MNFVTGFSFQDFAERFFQEVSVNERDSLTRWIFLKPTKFRQLSMYADGFVQIVADELLQKSACFFEITRIRTSFIIGGKK